MLKDKGERLKVKGKGEKLEKLKLKKQKVVRLKGKKLGQ